MAQMLTNLSGCRYLLSLEKGQSSVMQQNYREDSVRFISEAIAIYTQLYDERRVPGCADQLALCFLNKSLAVSGRDQLSREAALEIIAAINRLKGFTHPDSLSCLNLALDMGILQPEDNERVSFSSLTYQMYFMESCHDERLKQVVHEYFA
jgi:hypothetical protein